MIRPKKAGGHSVGTATIEDYSADLETDKEHARVLLPMMVFNAGHRDRSGARKSEVYRLGSQRISVN
jgi:hypothetical protein